MSDPDLESISTQADIGDVMDSLHFNYGDAPMPWDVNGHITAFDDIVIGTPHEDTQFWQLQTTGFTCAVVAQRGIIEAFTGQEISEAELVYQATANGWLTDGGMSPLDIGNLLKLYGIDCHDRLGATIEDLMAELAQGHKVIIGVDSGELWNSDHPLEDFFYQAADHAIWVTGVDLSDPANPKVFINDSGEPDGAGKAYDMQVFLDAWEDSGFFYVSTSHAPPNFHLAARGFDPAAEVFPEMVSYFGGFDGDFQNLLHGEEESTVQNIPNTDELTAMQSDEVRFGAGRCFSCSGTGTWWTPGSGTRACPNCGGSGVG